MSDYDATDMCMAAKARARVVVDGLPGTLIRWPGTRNTGSARTATVLLDRGGHLSVGPDHVRLLCARDGYDPDGCTGHVPPELAKWRLCDQCATSLIRETHGASA